MLQIFFVQLLSRSDTTGQDIPTPLAHLLDPRLSSAHIKGLKVMSFFRYGMSKCDEVRVPIVFAMILLCMVVPCVAQAGQERERGKSEEERPASESHSYMELFTKLERDWSQAIQKKDKAALEATLAPEFIYRSSEDPENPLSRADWMQQALMSSNIRAFSQRAIAIRAFLGVAVVSLVQREQSTVDGKDRSDDYFIVDLWEGHQDKWQVAARYRTPAGSRPDRDSKRKIQR